VEGPLPEFGQEQYGYQVDRTGKCPANTESRPAVLPRPVVDLDFANRKPGVHGQRWD
jgi:hypothetical protein